MKKGNKKQNQTEERLDGNKKAYGFKHLSKKKSTTESREVVLDLVKDRDFENYSCSQLRRKTVSKLPASLKGTGSLQETKDGLKKSNKRKRPKNVDVVSDSDVAGEALKKGIKKQKQNQIEEALDGTKKADGSKQHSKKKLTTRSREVVLDLMKNRKFEHYSRSPLRRKTISKLQACLEGTDSLRETKDALKKSNKRKRLNNVDVVSDSDVAGEALKRKVYMKTEKKLKLNSTEVVLEGEKNACASKIMKKEKQDRIEDELDGDNKATGSKWPSRKSNTGSREVVYYLDKDGSFEHDNGTQIRRKTATKTKHMILQMKHMINFWHRKLIAKPHRKTKVVSSIFKAQLPKIELNRNFEIEGPSNVSADSSEIDLEDDQLAKEKEAMRMELENDLGDEEGTTVIVRKYTDKVWKDWMMSTDSRSMGPDGKISSENNLKCTKAHSNFAISIAGLNWVVVELLCEARWYINKKNGAVTYDQIVANIKDNVIANLKRVIRRKKIPEDKEISGKLVIVDRNQPDCLVIGVQRKAGAKAYTFTSELHENVVIGIGAKIISASTMNENLGRREAQEEMFEAMELAAEDDIRTGGMCTIYTGGRCKEWEMIAYKRIEGKRRRKIKFCVSSDEEGDN